MWAARLSGSHSSSETRGDPLAHSDEWFFDQVVRKHRHGCCDQSSQQYAEPSDAAHVWNHAPADGGSAAARRKGTAARRNQSGQRRGVEKDVSEESLQNVANHGFLVPAKALPGTPGPLALEWMQGRSRAEATSGILACNRESKMEIPAIICSPANLRDSGMDEWQDH